MRQLDGRIIAGSEALDPQRPIDHVVAFPHSSNIELILGQIEPRLSLMSQMSIEAAATIWRQHPSSGLVIPGETCFEETDLPDTSDLMVEHIQKTSDPDANDSDLAPLHRLSDGRPLNNTYLQTMGLIEFFDGLPKQPGNILIETLEYHVARVRRTAEAYGIKANYVIAEDVLHELGVTEYDPALPVIAHGTRKTEALAYLLTIGNRKGTLMNTVMRKAGARLVDVVEDPDGNLVFENKLAKRKIATLTAQAELAQAA